MGPKWYYIWHKILSTFRQVLSDHLLSGSENDQSTIMIKLYFALNRISFFIHFGDILFAVKILSKTDLPNDFSICQTAVGYFISTPGHGSLRS